MCMCVYSYVYIDREMERYILHQRLPLRLGSKPVKPVTPVLLTVEVQHRSQGATGTGNMCWKW